MRGKLNVIDNIGPGDVEILLQYGYQLDVKNKKMKRGLTAVKSSVSNWH